MRMRKSLLASTFAFGVLITVISGFLDVTPPGILGARWHGWPLAWLYVIVYPGSPWSVDWLNFGGDIILWSVVSFAGLFALLHFLRYKK
jgi:hypothetical protein